MAPPRHYDHHPVLPLVILLLGLLFLSSTTTAKQRCWSTATTTKNKHNANSNNDEEVIVRRSKNNISTSSFSKCTDLPHLSATLYWSFDSLTSELSVLFVAPPARPSGWVGWAINPVAPRMLGAQALLAFRRPHDGSLAAATANISTYYPVVFSMISYEVRHMEAVEVDHEKELGIAATLRLPAGTDRVNHVWQVGPDVKVNGPVQHYFDDANLAAVGVLHL